MARVLIPYRHLSKLAPYEAATASTGLEVISVPVNQKPRLDGIHGLLLTGGTDVNPNLYGAPPAPEVDDPDDERDEVEWKLIDEALERDLPVLAICRGLQLLNVHHGGTLIQHLGLPEHDPEFEDKSAVAHEVEIQTGTLLARVVGTNRLQVNSRHHQAVDRPGQGLRVSARDWDGNTVEALEQTDRNFVIGVQWHPEDQVSTQVDQRRLFQKFAQACGQA